MEKLSNEQKAYYEEILCFIKFLIAIVCLTLGYKVIAIILFIWAAFDFYCASKYAIKSVMEEKEKQNAKPELCHNCDNGEIELTKVCNSCGKQY